MTVPAPRTWSPLDFVTAGLLNAEVRDALNFVLAPPRCLAYRGSNLTLVDGAWTMVGLGAELYDPYTPAMHNLVTNNSRVTAPETGIYDVGCRVRTSDIASTIIQYQVRVNAAGSETGGTRVFLRSQNGAGGGEATELGDSVPWPLTAGDYVELFVRCNTGSNPDAVLNAGADATHLSLSWRAKQ